MTRSSPIQLVWFKRSLRVADHAPLEQALQARAELGAVVPLYIHGDVVIQSEYASAQHQLFTYECLDELAQDLQSIGGALSEYHGTPVDVFDRIHRKVGVKAIWTYAETTLQPEFERDKAVKAWARAHGVRWHEYPQDRVARGAALQHKPSFQAYLDAAVKQPLPNVLGQDWSAAFNPRFYRVDRNTIALAGGPNPPGRPRGGRTAAKQAAQGFFRHDKLRNYPYSISSPLRAIEGCSRLSPYLSWGVVSDRQVLARLNELVSASYFELPTPEFEKIQSAAAFYAERLQWRQAYLQALDADCRVEAHLDRIEGLEASRWATYKPALLDAWLAGQTGYPYMDALMKHLQATGWLNFRARASLASFATMHLWLPAKVVATHLARLFADYCPGIHFPQMAIASGHGWGRNLLIYDPVKQGLDHDPKGLFIRRHLPNLRALPVEFLHQPWLAPHHMLRGYAQPVVPPDTALKVAKDKVYAFRLEHERKLGG